VLVAFICTFPMEVVPFPFTVIPSPPMVRAPLPNVRAPVVVLPFPTTIPATLVVPGTGWFVNVALLKIAMFVVRSFAGAVPPSQFVPVAHAVPLFDQVILPPVAAFAEPRAAVARASADSTLREDKAKREAIR